MFSQHTRSRFSAINFISPQQSNAEQNPLVHTFIIPQTIPLPSHSFNGLNCAHRNRQFKTRDTYNNTSPAHLTARMARTTVSKERSPLGPWYGQIMENEFEYFVDRPRPWVRFGCRSLLNLLDFANPKASRSCIWVNVMRDCHARAHDNR